MATCALQPCLSTHLFILTASQVHHYLSLRNMGKYLFQTKQAGRISRFFS